MFAVKWHVCPLSKATVTALVFIEQSHSSITPAMTYLCLWLKPRPGCGLFASRDVELLAAEVEKMPISLL